LKTLRNIFLAVAMILSASTAAILAPAAAAHASTSPFKVVNKSAGGCWKDQGLGKAYTTSTCSIASNFTPYESSSQWIDGTNYCPTVSNGKIVAGNCVLGVSTQEMSETVAGPQDYDVYLFTEYNYFGDGYFISKGGASPYYVNDNSNDGDNVWCTTNNTGC
jgi:hypothetical protein